jgi:hypothetical protein
VAAWRRKALELFPFLREAVQRPRSTVYEVFFLLPHVGAVMASGDTDLLRRIFAFAEWCAGQSAKDLWNAAGVGFYEHLFDGDNWPHRREVVRWLSPRVVVDCMGLWEHWLPPERFAEVQQLLAEQRGRMVGDST